MGRSVMLLLSLSKKVRVKERRTFFHLHTIRCIEEKSSDDGVLG